MYTERKSLMGTRGVPYDAEIEYLETDGSAYIDANLTINFLDGNTVKWLSNVGIASLTNVRRFLIAPAEFPNREFYCEINIYNQFAVGSQVTTTLAANTMYACEMELTVGTSNKITIYANGNTYSITDTSMSVREYTTPCGLYLFRIDNTYNGSGQRIGANKIYYNGELVRDFIPVRKGSVGYMYDRVSGQLFGNAGTGDFVLGGDIVPIEYLEATGTQYINTGIVASSNSKAEVCGNFTEHPTAYLTLVGSLSGSGPYLYTQFVAKVPNSSGKYYVQIGSSYATSNVSDLNKHTFIGSIQNNIIKLDIDGTSVQNNFSGTLSTNPQLIFAHLESEASTRSKARVYYCKLWNDGVLVRDMIPIRVGTTGYMYDKVSGQLFGNSGTGDFILGHDTIPGRDIVPIEYLESTGTLWIDTGIIPNANTGIFVDLMRFNNNDTYVCGLRNDTGATRWCIGCPNYYGYGAAINIDSSLTPSLNIKYGIGLNYQNDKKCTIPSTGVNMDIPTLNFTPTTQIRLFGSSGIVASYTSWTGRIYGCKISQGTDIIMDLIPVRVGQVGYMYDLVSGKLFGNVGSGNFILGGDIVPVEYLEGDNNAYIASKLSLAFTKGVNLKWLAQVGIASLGNTRRFLFSVAERYDRNFYCEINSNNELGFYRTVTTTALSANTMYACEMDLVVETSNSIKINANGTEYTASTTYYTSAYTTSPLDLYLFRINDEYKGSGQRIGANKIFYNNILVRDFIPVRVGTIGYMYDMVSHQLFGNEGTGSFTYGEDIIPVEYLESDGNAYINTNLSMDLNTSGNSFKWLSNIGIASLSNERRFLFSPADVYGNYFYCEVNANNVFGNGTVNTTQSMIAKKMHACEMTSIVGSSTNFKININGIEYTGNTYYQGTRPSNPCNIFLFRIGNNYRGSGQRIGSNKIYYNNTLVRDFIPVRVGTVGCMYDKVSRQLFYNAGTGAFTYGFDVYPRKSISRINTPELPGGFKRLDYVKNAVCGRALNMQIDFAYDMAYKAELRLAGTLTGAQQLLGLYGSGGSARTLWAYGNDMKFRSSYNRVNANATNGRSYETFNLNDADYNKHTFTAIPYNDNGTLRLSVNMDDTVKQDTLYEIYHATSTAKFYLFGLRESADEDIAKIPIEIYSLIIYNANGTEAANFIPCRHTSTDKVGFFDTVNKRFITDSFLIGSDEEIPSEYEKVDYVVNTALQALETGIKFKYNMSFYLDFRLKEVTTVDNTWICGVENNNRRNFARRGTSNNKFLLQYTKVSGSSSSNTTVDGSVVADTNRHLFMCLCVADGNDYKLYTYLDGVKKPTIQDSIIYSGGVTVNFSIYGLSPTGSITDVPIEVYSLILYNPDGTKALEYVPVKKPSTGEIGFYDKINRNFITRSWLSCYAPEEDYMQINSRGNGNVTITIPAAVDSNYMTSVSYSKDRVNWTTTNIDNTDQTITVPVTTSETVFLKGIGTTFSIGATGGYSKITSTANHDLSGNILSLLYGDNFIGKTTFPASVQHIFRALFKDSTTLVDADNLVLPVTNLKPYCYTAMFSGCTALVHAPKTIPATTATADSCCQEMFRDCSNIKTAPSLPATTLAAQCYYQMFRGCTSLTEAPLLPATTLANVCYANMFTGCTSLTSAPELPALTLIKNCYYYMFSGCTNLGYIKMLATDISADGCLNNWVNSVASTGTFVKAASMASLPSGASGIPSGWTVEDES